VKRDFLTREHATIRSFVLSTMRSCHMGLASSMPACSRISSMAEYGDSNGSFHTGEDGQDIGIMCIRMVLG